MIQIEMYYPSQWKSAQAKSCPVLPKYSTNGHRSLMQFESHSCMRRFERLTTVGAQVPHWHWSLKRSRCMLGLLLMHLRERPKGIGKLYWIIKLFEHVVTTHLVHVYSVQAHLGWCKLWRQARIRQAEHSGVARRHANEKVTSIT